MLAFIHLASVTEVAVVNGILKHVGNKGAPDKFPIFRAHSTFRKKMAQIVQRNLPRCITLKNLSDDQRSFTVNNDTLGAVVIQISKRSMAGILTAPDFFTKATLGIFRKRVNVVFALPKHDVEHELPLRVGFKTEGREFERFKFFGVEKINDTSAVNAVAGKAVGVPRENSVRFARLDACKHIVENRPAGNLGRLLFDQFSDDAKPFPLGEFAQLVDLRINGQDLLVLNIGGFTGVKEKSAV